MFSISGSKYFVGLPCGCVVPVTITTTEATTQREAVTITSMVADLGDLVLVHRTTTVEFSDGLVLTAVEREVLTPIPVAPAPREENARGATRQEEMALSGWNN